MTTDSYAGKALPTQTCKCGHGPEAHTWRGTGECGRLECTGKCDRFHDASAGGFTRTEIEEMMRGGPGGR